MPCHTLDTDRRHLAAGEAVAVIRDADLPSRRVVVVR